MATGGYSDPELQTEADRDRQKVKERDSGYPRTNAGSVDQDNAEPPQLLSDPYLLDLFKDFTLSDVKLLGILLQLSRAQIAQIQERCPQNPPPMQALEVFHKWKNSKRNWNEHDAHFELGEVLKEMNHGRAARNLTSRQRLPTRIGLSERSVYLKVKDFDDQQAHGFGLALGLSTNVIDNIMRKEADDNGGIKALSMFVEWKKASELTDSVMLDKLNKAMTEVGLPQDSLQVRGNLISPPPVLGVVTEHVPTIAPTESTVGVPPTNNGENTPLLEQPNRYGTTQTNTSDHENNTDVPKVFLGNTPKIKFTCLCISWTILVFLIIAAVILAFFALKYTQETTIIRQGDTIALPLSSPPPPFLELLLWGPEDYCEGTVISVNCHNIVTNSTVVNDPTLNYEYLVQGSSVIIDSQDIPERLRPYRIWLFDNLELAKHAVENQFEFDHGYNCRRPMKGAQCHIVNPDDSKPVVFNITSSSYYFLRCEEGPSFNCTQVTQWYFHEVTYNFSLTIDMAVSRTVIKAQDTSSHLRLRHEYFPLPLSTSNKCVLAKLDAATCGSNGDMFFLSFKYTSLVREIIVYVACGLGVWLIITISVTCCICKFNIKV